MTIVSKCRSYLSPIIVAKDKAMTSKDIGMASSLVLFKRYVNFVGRESLILDIGKKRSSAKLWPYNTTSLTNSQFPLKRLRSSHSDVTGILLVVRLNLINQATSSVERAVKRTANMPLQMALVVLGRHRLPWSLLSKSKSSLLSILSSGSRQVAQRLLRIHIERLEKNSRFLDSTTTTPILRNS